MDAYIVTGAGKGIGRGISKLLISQNYYVIKVDRELFEDPETTNSDENYLINLNEIDSIKELFNYCEEKAFCLKGIIHCAGLCPVQCVSDIQYKDMETVYGVNTFSFIELCRCFFQYKRRCPDARILAISSITSDRPYKNQLLYSSSKAALNQISYSMAQEGIERDVKVNILQLGAVETDMFRSLNPNMQTIYRHYPLGLMTIDEVSEIVCDLITEKYKKMTGSIIRMDSGFFVSH